MRSLKMMAPLRGMIDTDAEKQARLRRNEKRPPWGQRRPLRWTRMRGRGEGALVLCRVRKTPTCCSYSRCTGDQLIKREIERRGAADKGKGG